MHFLHSQVWQKMSLLSVMPKSSFFFKCNLKFSAIDLFPPPPPPPAYNGAFSMLEKVVILVVEEPFFSE